jgi:hypothetical protein
MSGLPAQPPPFTSTSLRGAINAALEQGRPSPLKPRRRTQFRDALSRAGITRATTTQGMARMRKRTGFSLTLSYGLTSRNREHSFP